MLERIKIPIPDSLRPAIDALKAVGGRPFLVGGAVRDFFMCLDSKDFDIEVYGLTPDKVQEALSTIGQVDLVGAQFGVFKVAGIPADFSVPRTDSKTGEGHRGFAVEFHHGISVIEAARRRDLTINSLAYDLTDGVLHDYFNGKNDIRFGWLRATDPGKFNEDPLRAMRVAQFVSRFGFNVDEELVLLCQKSNLSELPGERLFVEWEKLLKGKAPDEGLEFLRATGLLDNFPELAATIDCPQEKEWHPEGCVFVHTKMAVHRARLLTDDPVVHWATLLHDVGKPPTTKVEDGRIRSKGHEEAGVEPAKAFLERLRAPKDLQDKVAVLVAHHLAPAHFVPDAAHAHKRTKAGPAAYRRLARTLAAAGTDMKTLYLVSKADHLGRTTKDALLGLFPSGDEFLRMSQEVKVELKPEPDAVMGRDLIERGFKPGPEMGVILKKCREVQYERGIQDKDEILSIVTRDKV